jgi:hypothetical protein
VKVFAHGAGQRPEVVDSVIADVDHLGDGYRRPSAPRDRHRERLDGVTT